MLAAITKSDRFTAYLQLMRMDKPVPWLLLLWPTLWGLWVAANGHPSLKLFLIFTAGVLLTRSAGCVVNDFADQRFDGAVKRTAQRPLVNNRVSKIEAVLLAAVLFLIAFILVLQLNYLTIALSFVGLFLAVIYPFLKRYTNLPQIWLGAAFAWGIPMAFAATLNSIPWQGWYLFLTTLIWIVAYDAMYAMVDREDDLKIGVKSIAILFGQYDVFIISLLQVAVITLLLCFGMFMHYGPAYFICILVAGCFAAYQIYLIHDRQPDNCLKAFLNNSWFGFFVFLGVCL